MGSVMSFVGRGPVYAEMLAVLSGTLYEKFIQKNITDFNDFHIAVLDIFNTFNSALPGKHYNVPSHSDTERFHKEWVTCNPDKQKEEFIKFLMERAKLNKIDTMTVIAGVATPPIAMAAKRAGEKVPQLKIIKSIPDVLFVPTTTLLVLMSITISRQVLMGTMASEHHREETNHHDLSSDK